MVNKWFIFIGLFLSFWLSACSRKRLSAEKFQQYYNDNRTRLVETYESENLLFEAAYLPEDLLALRESCDNGHFDAKTYQKLSGNYDSAFYFSLKITPLNNVQMKKIIQTKENYSEIVHYLTAEIKKDFHLELDHKKISCGIINVESELAIQNGFLFVMSFEKPAVKQMLEHDLTLVYQDQLFRNGIIKFRFNKTTINDFPKIKAS